MISSKFEHVDEFALEHESLFMNDEAEYDEFNFYDVGYVGFIANVVYA